MIKPPTRIIKHLAEMRHQKNHKEMMQNIDSDDLVTQPTFPLVQLCPLLAPCVKLLHSSLNTTYLRAFSHRSHPAAFLSADNKFIYTWINPSPWMRCLSINAVHTKMCTAFVVIAIMCKHQSNHIQTGASSCSSCSQFWSNDDSALTFHTQQICREIYAACYHVVKACTVCISQFARKDVELIKLFAYNISTWQFSDTTAKTLLKVLSTGIQCNVARNLGKTRCNSF